MKRIVFSGIMLTLLISMLTLAFNIQSANATETIYIRVDGSVEGTDKIQRDRNTYTFTGNLYDSIVVERSNIIIDGNGYTVQGTGASGDERGISLNSVNNVTIEEANIKDFRNGIFFRDSSRNSISGNNITRNWESIYLLDSTSNSIYGNNITKNVAFGIDLLDSTSNSITGNNITKNIYGICLWGDSDNSVSGNNIVNNEYGIVLASSDNKITGNNIVNNNYGIGLNSWSSSISGNNITNNGIGIDVQFAWNNIVSGNTIANNGIGIWGEWNFDYNTVSENNITNNALGIYLEDSRGNSIYHNNFIGNDNTAAARISVSSWDNGYPSGGNYWSDYTDVDLYKGPNQNETGSDGIWDHPYVIDAENQDKYPLVNPYTTPPIVAATVDMESDTLNLRSKGKWVTAYIQLSEGYNAGDIDSTRILLNDTASPVLDPKFSFVTNSSEYLVDHSGDGILEYMVKFDRETVESFIYNEGIRWGNVTLTITGKLLDGTPFEGCAVVFVRFAGDVNNDGKIDVLDAAAVSAHWYPGPPRGLLGYDENADLNKDGLINIIDSGIISSNWGQTLP